MTGPAGLMEGQNIQGSRDRMSVVADHKQLSKDTMHWLQTPPYVLLTRKMDSVSGHPPTSRPDMA